MTSIDRVLRLDVQEKNVQEQLFLKIPTGERFWQQLQMRGDIVLPTILTKWGRIAIALHVMKSELCCKADGPTVEPLARVIKCVVQNDFLQQQQHRDQFAYNVQFIVGGHVAPVSEYRVVWTNGARPPPLFFGWTREEICDENAGAQCLQLIFSYRAWATFDKKLIQWIDETSAATKKRHFDVLAASETLMLLSEAPQAALIVESGKK